MPSVFSESKLKREFEQYGTVKSIRMVMSTKDTKPRGYAFIEYEHEKDMHCKYQCGTTVETWVVRGFIFVVMVCFEALASLESIKSALTPCKMWVSKIYFLRFLILWTFVTQKIGRYCQVKERYLVSNSRFHSKLAKLKIVAPAFRQTNLVLWFRHWPRLCSV